MNRRMITMETKTTPINYTPSLCFKCLKEFNNIHKLEISHRSYGSNYDNFNSTLQLCNNCHSPEYNAWFSEAPTNDDINYYEEYQYESDIHNLIKSLPIQGQELFENSLSYGACAGYNMNPQDWIDIELGIAPDSLYKEYGLYSPSEIKSYHDRFPVCDKVYLYTYSDGSSCTRCSDILGATGNKDGSCNVNISTACHRCTRFNVRDDAFEMKTVDERTEFYNSERIRLNEMIEYANSRLKLIDEGKLNCDDYE